MKKSNEEIIYLYAADGRKMHKRYKDSSGNYFFTNYSAEYVYNDDQLDYATHPEGICWFHFLCFTIFSKPYQNIEYDHCNMLLQR